MAHVVSVESLLLVCGQGFLSVFTWLEEVGCSPVSVCDINLLMGTLPHDLITEPCPPIPPASSGREDFNTEILQLSKDLEQDSVLSRTSLTQGGI